VEISPEEIAPILVEKGKAAGVTASVTLTDSLQAPVSAGQVVGKITYSLEDEVVGECRLLANGQVLRLTFPLALVKLVENLVKI
jgi:D-alanyl-D-alanine carboxypeptidase (penicillin-binding protein 5/6)